MEVLSARLRRVLIHVCIETAEMCFNFVKVEILPLYSNVCSVVLYYKYYYFGYNLLENKLIFVCNKKYSDKANQ